MAGFLHFTSSNDRGVTTSSRAPALPLPLFSGLAASSGHPLPTGLRIRMERLFEADFAAVRWHEGEEATRVGAIALTVGEHLYFRRGCFRPGNPAGLFVIGHELAHVLQQRHGLTAGYEGCLAEDPELEAEADAAGLSATLGLPVCMASVAHTAHTGRGARRSTVACAQPIKLQINTAGGVIDAATLCNIIDGEISWAVTGRSGSGVPRITPNPLRRYHLSSGIHWVDVVGRLNKFGIKVPGYGQRPRDSLLDCEIRVGRIASWMAVRAQGNTERIDFTDRAATIGGRTGSGDLNYIQVADGFRSITKSDRWIARDMLLIMMGKDPIGGYTDPQLDFLAGMVALMFGVEASRFPSCLATSLMFLDLVMFSKCYGRTGNKPFTLADAFDKPTAHFDHGDLYGGKFPCAVHAPGPGNSANRRMLGDMGAKPKTDAERLKYLNMTLHLNHRFIVPRREVTLFIHWIEFAHRGPQFPHAQCDQTQAPAAHDGSLFHGPAPDRNGGIAAQGDGDAQLRCRSLRPTDARGADPKQFRRAFLRRRHVLPQR